MLSLSLKKNCILPNEELHFLKTHAKFDILNEYDNDNDVREKVSKIFFQQNKKDRNY